MIESIQIALAELDDCGTTGCGETQLSVGWSRHGELSFLFREKIMLESCRLLASEFSVTDIGFGY